MLDTYTIVGYDKDNDVYEVLDDGYSLSLEAEIEARKLVLALSAGQLRRKNGEPLDWIEIYHDYGGEEETMVWTSYDDEAIHMQHFSLLAEFRVLKHELKGKYRPLSKNEAGGLTIGGFSFVVRGQSIPFDWDACAGNYNEGVFRFVTGKGFLFNDYILTDCYDGDYETLGIHRSQITAEMLASTEGIEEFGISFYDQIGCLDVSLGWYKDNAEESDLKIELLSVGLEEIETGNKYFVKAEVIKNFNLGKIQI